MSRTAGAKSAARSADEAPAVFSRNESRKEEPGGWVEEVVVVVVGGGGGGGGGRRWGRGGGRRWWEEVVVVVGGGGGRRWWWWEEVEEEEVVERRWWWRGGGGGRRRWEEEEVCEREEGSGVREVQLALSDPRGRPETMSGRGRGRERRCAVEGSRQDLGQRGARPLRSGRGCSSQSA